MSAKAVAGIRAALRIRAALFATMSVTFALALSTSVHAATITVDSLADTGAPGICVLRDAITAANTKTATNACVAGTGHDAIQFSVTGTIPLESILPKVKKQLTIKGPASPGITIEGGGAVPIMMVGSGAALSLKHLTIADGFAPGNGGGIYNNGTLTVTIERCINNRNICAVMLRFPHETTGESGRVGEASAASGAAA